MVFAFLVWLDVRTSKIVDDLIKNKGAQCVSAVTQSSGLPLSTYFSSVKLKWLLQNVTAVREAVNLGECMAGTVDSWLIWVRINIVLLIWTYNENVHVYAKVYLQLIQIIMNWQNLTGGSHGGIHATDVTNASRTQLMSLKSLQWDEGLLRFFDIPLQILPKIKSSAEIYGYISKGSLLGVPIAGVSMLSFDISVTAYCSGPLNDPFIYRLTAIFAI